MQSTYRSLEEIILMIVQGGHTPCEVCASFPCQFGIGGLKLKNSSHNKPAL